MTGKVDSSQFTSTMEPSIFFPEKMSRITITCTPQSAYSVVKAIADFGKVQITNILVQPPNVMLTCILNVKIPKDA